MYLSIYTVTVYYRGEEVQQTFVICFAGWKMTVPKFPKHPPPPQKRSKIALLCGVSIGSYRVSQKENTLHKFW